MNFRYCIASFRLALLLLIGVVEASAQKAPSARSFERLDRCELSPDEWTDGDSFRVRLPDGRLGRFDCLSLIQLDHAGSAQTSRLLTSFLMRLITNVSSCNLNGGRLLCQSDRFEKSWNPSR